MNKFFLLAEYSFHPSYLISKWYETFRDYDGFGGIIVRANENEELHSSRMEFHNIHQNKKHLTDEEGEYLQSLYGGLSKSEKVMIQWYGVPYFAQNLSSHLFFLGEDINSELIKTWLLNKLEVEDNIFVFVFVDKILSPWWIKVTKGNLFNAHSAVLPYARGMFSIERMAYRGNVEKFQQAAGASIHYVDEGIDTGSIIKAVRIKNPFAFKSLPEVKAHTHNLAFDLLVQLAVEILDNPQNQPAGIKSDPSLLGPVFATKNYTSQVETIAEQNFLEMKINNELALYFGP